jgi:competence protein ComEA
MDLSPTTLTKIILFAAALASVQFIAACDATGNATQPANVRATPAPNAIDINRASAEELMSLPGIGETIAERIIEFRQKNGLFRRPEELLLVPGISEKKFREIRTLVKTDPAPHDD